MTLTLLIDLDDTLLVNPPDLFVPAYFQKLAQHLAPVVDPQDMVQALKAGTRRMVENQNPDCSLKEVFESVFYPALRLRPDDLVAILDEFYAEVFPTLRKYTQPMPGGVALVEEALARDYRIAIATTPLFPRTASLQRLEWAGLPVEKYRIELVTSFETFHFAKPHPAFFAEVLAQLGWPEGPVLVVGDDPVHDLQPAKVIGLRSYKVTEDEPDVYANGAGQLTDLLKWIDEQPAESLKPHFDLPGAIQATMLSTPAALRVLGDEIEEEAWAIRPRPEAWALTEILCHLRDVEAEINLPRLQKVIDENNPFLPGIDSDKWAEERAYIRQDGAGALGQFSTARQKTLGILAKLKNQAWERPIRHAIFGPTRLRELVNIMAGHDRIHVRQIKDLI